MTKFAIRGLLSRKLRTALTAIAIVLGVAMISGTYVLTDSIDQAFDRIFTDIRKGSNAVISGKSAVDLSDQDGLTPPTLDDSLLPQVRALPGVAVAEGSVDSDATQLIGDDGKAVVSGGAPNLGFSIANGDSVFNPLTLVDGQVARSERGRRRQGDRRRAGLHGGREDRRPGRGPGRATCACRDRPVQLGAHDRRRDARRLRSRDRAAHVQEGRSAGRDRRRREARTSRTASSSTRSTRSSHRRHRC